MSKVVGQWLGVILIKHLVRRQCQRDTKCCFCSSEESIQHLACSLVGFSQPKPASQQCFPLTKNQHQPAQTSTSTSQRTGLQVEPATEYYFSQILLLGDPDSLLLGKKKTKAVVFSLKTMLWSWFWWYVFTVRSHSKAHTGKPLQHQLGLCVRRTSTSKQDCTLFWYH